MSHSHKKPHDKHAAHPHSDPDGACSEAPETAQPDTAQPEIVEALEARVAELAAQLKETQELRLRAVADFQNLQRRVADTEVRLLGSGIVAAARNVIPVIEHFDLALTQDPATMNAQAAHDGLRMLRDELVKALEKSGVEVISPRTGDAFDPTLHEAIMQQAAEGVQPGHVAATFQAGYRMGETVIRAAKVSVAP